MRTIVVWVALLGGPVWAGTALDQAKEHLGAGRFQEAIDAAAKVAEAEAEDYARARYLKGEVELLLGDPASATKSFRDALRVRPGSAVVLTGLGRALLAAEDADEAAGVLDDAVKADPKSGRALCFYGIALKSKSLGRKGDTQIAKGIRLAPKDPVVARAAVLHWVDEDKLPRARKEAARFAKARKDHPMGPFLQGLVLEREKEYDDAIEAYEKALERDDTFLDAHKNLAILCITQNPLYRDKKRTEKAMQHFERYFALGGKDAEVRRIHEQLKAFLPTLGR